MMVCCAVLAAWIAILILTLPGHYTSDDWRTVWVGLDVAELVGFAATGWAAWHQRQALVFCMIITGTLLVCDAWFDVTLDYGSRGFTTSVVSAVLVELPLAFLMFTSARRLVRATIGVVMQLSGVDGSPPPLRRIPLFADGIEECLPDRLRQLAEDVTADHRPASLASPPRAGLRRGPAGNATAGRWLALRTAWGLPCRPWPLTSPRKQPPTRSSRASRKPRTRGCVSC